MRHFFQIALLWAILVGSAFAGYGFVWPQTSCNLRCLNGGVCTFNYENPSQHRCECLIGVWEGERCQWRVGQPHTDEYLEEEQTIATVIPTINEDIEKQRLAETQQQMEDAKRQRQKSEEDRRRLIEEERRVQQEKWENDRRRAQELQAIEAAKRNEQKKKEELEQAERRRQWEERMRLHQQEVEARKKLEEERRQATLIHQQQQEEAARRAEEERRRADEQDKIQQEQQRIREEERKQAEEDERRRYEEQQKTLTTRLPEITSEEERRAQEPITAQGGSRESWVDYDEDKSTPKSETTEQLNETPSTDSTYDTTNLDDYQPDSNTGVDYRHADSEDEKMRIMEEEEKKRNDENELAKLKDNEEYQEQQQKILNEEKDTHVDDEFMDEWITTTIDPEIEYDMKYSENNVLHDTTDPTVDADGEGWMMERKREAHVDASTSCTIISSILLSITMLRIL